MQWTREHPYWGKWPYHDDAWFLWPTWFAFTAGFLFFLIEAGVMLLRRRGPVASLPDAFPPDAQPPTGPRYDGPSPTHESEWGHPYRPPPPPVPQTVGRRIQLTTGQIRAALAVSIVITAVLGVLLYEDDPRVTAAAVLQPELPVEVVTC